MPLAAPLLETRLNGLAPQRQGKVRDIFDLRRRAADGRHRPHLRVRLRARLRHSRQGQGAHAALGVLVRAHAVDRAESLLIGRRRRAIRTSCGRHGDMLGGRSMLVRKTNPVPIECVARGYLSGSGWKEYVGNRLGLRRARCRPACASPIACRRRSSRRPPRPTAATTSTSARQEAGRLVGVDLMRTAARSDAGALRPRREARRVARHHPRRHQVRVRSDRPARSILLSTK